MTTISYPNSNVGNLLVGVVGGALAMLILVAALALAALNAPIAPVAPEAGPAQYMNSNFSGVMQHAP